MVRHKQRVTIYDTIVEQTAVTLLLRGAGGAEGTEGEAFNANARQAEQKFLS